MRKRQALSDDMFPLLRTAAGEVVEVEDDDLAGGCAVWFVEPYTFDRIRYVETDKSILAGATPIMATVH